MHESHQANMTKQTPRQVRSIHHRQRQCPNTTKNVEHAPKPPSKHDQADTKTSQRSIYHRQRQCPNTTKNVLRI
eukprot:1160766-Pelagomonas_calceolata.AAC.15